MLTVLTAAEFNAAYIAQQLSEAGVRDCGRGATPIASEAAVESVVSRSCVARVFRTMTDVSSSI